MSRAFTKERDDAPDPTPAPGPRGAYYVTADDLAKLPADDERRGRAELVKVNAKNIGFGATVTVCDERGRKTTYSIVNDEDAAPATGSIGIASPLAQALLGKRAGESATWHRPVGDAEIKIESFAYPKRETSPAND